MKAKIIVLMIVMVSLNACKNKGRQVESIPSITKEEVISDNDIEQLTLNDGEKWEANEETHKGFEEMSDLLKSFDVSNDKNYKQLGENLSEQTGYVIKHCTMKGEAHDQLHIVLVPILNEVSDMKESENNQQAEHAKENVETLVESYFVYFKH